MAYKPFATHIVPIRTIKDIRKEDTVLTAQEVANKAGIAISTYSRVEQGAALENVSLGTFICIAQAFDMKPSELLQMMGIDTKEKPDSWQA